MAFDLFRRVVDGQAGLRRITLQGLGEPLLAPEIMEMIAYATERGIDVGFNTNAQLLTPDRSDQLVAAGVAWLCVSVDGARAETYEAIRGGAHFERLEQHVPALVDAVRRHGGRRPELSIVFVAMRRNIAELPDLVETAARWGVHRVRVQNLSHSFDDTDPSGNYADIRRYAAEEALWTGGDLAVSQAAFAAARKRADALGVELRLPRLSDAATTGRRKAGEPGCDWPWRSAYITHRGAVQPCCMVMGSDRVSLGDATAEPFEQIWQGESYAEFRDALLGNEPPEVCRGCSLYRGVF
jgi:radical SAM protein with 4Fe4S-binding SPASM domain